MTGTAKRVIVPFFISHRGCPHTCVFCDQRSISGAGGGLPSPVVIRETVRRYRESSGQTSVEVAFYGGSFTLLPEAEQHRLLEPLQPLLDDGRVSGIRISTRPDAIDAGTVRLLEEMRVSLVELGVQSLDDMVLAASGRGHRAEDTVQAFHRLHDAGMAVGGQIMPGLPGDTPATALKTCRDLLALNPACLRIYPAVVLAGTELAARWRRGEYEPLSLVAAVSLAARMLQAAHRAGVPVIRMGLQASDTLSGPSGIVAGPWHPAFRHLVESELAYDLILTLAGNEAGPVTVHAHPAWVSAVSGQNAGNRGRLADRGITLLQILPDQSLAHRELAVTITGITRKGNIVTDLNYPGPEARHA